MIDFTRKRAQFSIEVFPPKNNIGLPEIYASMGRFSALSPDYISVTYGAGGAGSMSTAEIASDIKNKFGIESVAHLICVSSEKKDIDAALALLREKNVNHILALRGDRREGEKASDFRYASDLIAYIKKTGGFEIAAACYPEGHVESPNYENDLNVMKIKAGLGVSHFISQLFFDNADFYRMLDGALKLGVNIPIEAGIMPVVNVKQITRMVSLSGSKIPARLKKLIEKFGENNDSMRAAGLNYASEQISDLLASGIRGIHLYAMNNPSIVETVYKNIAYLL
jgi:5,10-methylenetetrahydrofolate reductase